MRKELMRLSRFMSLALRHKPFKVGVELDPEGWAPLDQFIEGCRKAGFKDIKEEQVVEIAATNFECKFFVEEQHGRRVIKAATGHTALDGKTIGKPARVSRGFPDRMYSLVHKSALSAIRRVGLTPSGQDLDNVRLSSVAMTGDQDQVLLAIDTKAMRDGGYKFTGASDADSWKVPFVPESFIETTA